jgi:hypothetical protein
MTFQIRLDDDQALELLRALGGTGDVILTVEEPHTERRFEPGDRVRVHFDDGPGPATVLGVTVSHGEQFVQVSYGRGGKYRTSLSPGSVQTDNVIHHPARIVSVDPAKP